MTTSFVSVFGGTVTSPSDVAYAAYSLTANTELQWPLEVTTPVNPVAASVMDINPTIAGLHLLLPDATVSSPASALMISNVGANSFTVQDNGGSDIVVIAPSQVYLVYLTGNGSAAGTWRTIQMGATTASAVASALAGNGLKVTGSLLALAIPTFDKNVSGYTIGESDRAHLLRWIGGVGTFNLPDPATMADDFITLFRNDGSGILTLQPAAGTINGGAAVTVNPGGSGFIIAQGTLYITVGVGISQTVGFDYTTINIAGGPGNYVLSGTELNRVSYKLTGVLTGNRSIVVPNTVQQYWIDNSTTGAFTVDVKTAAQITPVAVTQGQRAIMYCDGTNVLDADTQGIATPVAIAQGGTGATTAANARTNLGSTSVGDAVFIAASAAAARTALGSTAVGDAVFIAASAAAALTALTAPGLTLSNTFSNQQNFNLSSTAQLLQLTTTVNTAAEAAGIDIARSKPAGNVNDLGSSLTFSHVNTASAKKTQFKFLTKWLNVGGGTEAAEMDLFSIIGGALTQIAAFASGLVLGAPTGGDKGLGALNTAGLHYVNGVPLALSDIITTGTSAAPGLSDHGKLYAPTGAGFTLTLPQISSVFQGYKVGIHNYCASGTCVANRSSTDTIISQGTGGLTSLTLPTVSDLVWFKADVANSRWLVEGERSFESSAVALTTGAVSTQPHSLGVRPNYVQLFARCITGDSNYAVGDEIPMPGQCYAGSNAIQKACDANATNVYIIQGTGGDAANFRLLDRSSPAGQVLTTTINWNLVVRARVVN